MTGPSALARLAAVDAAAFAADHWDRRPLLSRAADLPPGLPHLLTPDAVDELVAERALRQPFFRLVRRGESVGACTRTAVAGNRTIHDLADADAVSAAYADGATLVLQSAHRLLPAVGRLCRDLAAELGHETQCNAYVTPAGRAQGFDFHHDTHDVFVVQTHGRKHWQVHRPVVELPTKTQARSGADLVDPAFPPAYDIVLEPGDVLYLPRGWVHAADTDDAASVHLTIGVVATTWLDLIDDLVATGRDALTLREALPLATGDDGANARELLRRLGSWVDGLTADDLVDVVVRRRARAARPVPLRPMRQAADAGRVTADTVVTPRSGLRVTASEQADRVSLRVGTSCIGLPVAAADLVRRLLAAPTTAAGAVAGDPVLGIDDALVVVRRLLREGVLVVDGR